MTYPVVYAFFALGPDDEGRLPLSYDGTRKDLERLGIELSEGLILRVTDYDEFSALGTVTWHEQQWWAVVDWNQLGPALDPDP